MTVHERPVGATVEWYTPPELFAALGARFDLDPASPCPPVPWVPANTFYCSEKGRHERGAQSIAQPALGYPAPPRHDGRLFSESWNGHVWLNPPYGPAGVALIDRMTEHGDGLLLLPSRTETAVYQRALAAADVVCLLRDRLWFVRDDGFKGRSSFGSTLFAFGEWAADVLRRSDLGWLNETRVRWHHNPDAPPEHFCEDCDSMLRQHYSLCSEIERLQNVPAALQPLVAP